VSTKVHHRGALGRPHGRKWGYPCGDYSQIQCATTEYASPATQGAYVTYNQTTPAVTNQRRTIRIPTDA
jgi:hypothetical protein